MPLTEDKSSMRHCAPLPPGALLVGSGGGGGGAGVAASPGAIVDVSTERAMIQSPVTMGAILARSRMWVDNQGRRHHISPFPSDIVKSWRNGGIVGD